jgi:tetratricopeptide (TPR) repeat protein
VVSSGGQRFALDIKGRPSAEYIEKEGKKYFEGPVAANYIPALSQIRGNAWLLGIRYFQHPASIEAIASQSVDRMKPFPPLEVRFDAIAETGSLNTLTYDLRSAHFWWESHNPADHEVRPPPALVDAFYSQGEKAAARKNFQRASYCYQQSFSLSPRSVDILFKLANSYFQLKEWETGFKTLTSFIKKNPDLPEPLLVYANLLEQINQKAAALSAYRLFLFRFPSHPLSSQVRQRIAELSISTP